LLAALGLDGNQPGQKSGAQLPVASAAARGVEAGTTPPATEAQGRRFLIEEWRRSELNVVDSVHHVVLVRLGQLYDSAQRSTVSAGDQFRILQEIDVTNAANQFMWIERRADVNRTADSTARAAGLPRAP
jgi:hypothetical protein